MDAEDASNLTGQYCVAMLSDTLKLYFNELSCRVIRRDLTKDAQKRREKEGFVPVYRDSLADYFSVNWPDVPIDFDIIEQIVLARNNAMHGQELYSKTIYHNSKTVKKFPSPLFATEWELEEFKPQDGELSVFSTPRVIVEKQKLDAAIAEVEKLSDWIDSQIYCAPASNTRSIIACVPFANSKVAGYAAPSRTERQNASTCST